MKRTDVTEMIIAAKLKKGLPIGTSIKNTAYIYFDYNPAVITNTTSSTLTNLTTGIAKAHNKIGLQAYPNPANEELILHIENEAKGGELRVLNMIGKVVLQIPVSSSYMKINTALLPQGIYLLSLNSDNNTINTKISVVH